jgi:monoamine oxidase
MGRMTSNKPSVTIAGAGLAGLAAALDLHRAGWQTTVLEARNRVGGRVVTVRDGFSGGQYAEGGGEFIEDFHHRMLAFVREFNLSLDPIGVQGDDWVRWVALEGKSGQADDLNMWGMNINDEEAKIWTALAELGKQVPDPEHPHDSPQAATLDNQSIADWLNTLDVHSLAKKVFIARMRSEYTVEPECQSLLDLARWGAYYYDQPERARTAFRVRGGNDQIPWAIAKLLPDVRMGAAVTAVQWGENDVTVTYTDEKSGEQKHHTSDFVVLAIPFLPMRSIKFDPPLPPDHADMIATLAYGSVTKVLIQYSQRIWDGQNWTGHAMTDLPITCIWHPTEAQDGESGILTVYTGAEAARSFSAMSDEERIQTAIAQVEQVCPGSAQYVMGARTVAWNNEPFTQASYAAFAPGQVTAYWQRLRIPLGRLYFAGEHTAVHQGYMEGAVESGQRAAQQLLTRAG